MGKLVGNAEIQESKLMDDDESINISDEEAKEEKFKKSGINALAKSDMQGFN